MQSEPVAVGYIATALAQQWSREWGGVAEANEVFALRPSFLREARKIWDMLQALPYDGREAVFRALAAAGRR